MYDFIVLIALATVLITVLFTLTPFLEKALTKKQQVESDDIMALVNVTKN